MTDITVSRELLRKVLSSMDMMLNSGEWYCAQERADALRAALDSEPAPAERTVQEPVAWLEYARKKPSLRRLVFERTSDKALTVDGWVSEPLSRSAPQAQQPAPAPVQEPVAWAIFTDAGNARMWTTFQPHIQKLADAEGLTVTPLYTAQPQRSAVRCAGKAVKLSDDEIEDLFRANCGYGGDDFWSVSRAVEAAFVAKNNLGVEP